MLIQLKQSFFIGSGLEGRLAIDMPRAGEPFDGLAIREAQISIITPIIAVSEAVSISLCSTRGFKDKALINAPNAVINWSSYAHGMVDTQAFVDINRWQCLSSAQAMIDWVKTDTAKTFQGFLEIYFEEVSLTDVRQIDMRKNKGWVY